MGASQLLQDSELSFGIPAANLSATRARNRMAAHGALFPDGPEMMFPTMRRGMGGFSSPPPRGECQSR